MCDGVRIMKEYIVTGANGYLGYILVQKLVGKGYFPIKIIIRSPKSFDRFKGLPIKAAIGDILDKDFISKQITPGSVIFHLAGVIDIGTVKNKLIYDINVKGCQNIVDACIQNKAEKLIYTSSVSVIKPLKNNKLMKEPTVFEPKILAGHYAKSKAMATQYIIDKSKNEGLNAVVVYPSAIIGPYDYNISNLGQVVLDYINHRLTAYVKGGYNFVDVRDVADGLINCNEKGKSGEGYILTGESISLKQMFLILNEKLNRSKMPTRLPLPFIKIMLPLAELHYLIRRKKPVFSSCSIKILNQNSNFDNTKAKEQLDFKPRSARESLCDMVDWLFKNKANLIKQQYLR